MEKSCSGKCLLERHEVLVVNTKLLPLEKTRPSKGGFFLARVLSKRHFPPLRVDEPLSIENYKHDRDEKDERHDGNIDKPKLFDVDL